MAQGLKCATVSATGSLRKLSSGIQREAPNPHQRQFGQNQGGPFGQNPFSPHPGYQGGHPGLGPGQGYPQNPYPDTGVQSNVSPPPYGQNQGQMNPGNYQQGYGQGYPGQGYPGQYSPGQGYQQGQYYPPSQGYPGQYPQTQGYGPGQGYPPPDYPGRNPSPAQAASSLACTASCIACLTFLLCSCCQALTGSQIGGGIDGEGGGPPGISNVTSPPVPSDVTSPTSVASSED